MSSEVPLTGSHLGQGTLYATLNSSCVSIESRLNPAICAGVHPADFQGRNDYSGDLQQVPCTKGEHHKACDQIFPLITHPEWRTPTVKHNCPRTVVSAALRACSNRVKTNADVLKGFSTYFKNIFIPKFLKFMDEEEITVDLDTWLKSGRYNKAYQAKLVKSIGPELADGSILEYGSFPKIEMQFTTVPHEDKDTPQNDVKERQICSPPDLKKCIANPFIHLLEGIAHKYFKSYCGRKNWQDICETLEEVFDRISDPIAGAADGSGFDMSQLRELNELLNCLLEACAKHPNVTWNEPLTVDLFLKAIMSSLELFVSCANGDLKYRAEGRASGDGWTTFGNTIMMIAYWEYTYHIAGITEFALLVKGDDVLLVHDKKWQSKFLAAKAVVFTERKDEHSHGLAQICKKIDFGDISDLDFLSNHFFWTGKNRLRMTRIPARVIQTISWTTKLPNTTKVNKLEDSRRELAFSKGMCLLAWGRGLPIWEVLGRKLVDLGKPGRLTEFNEYSDGQRRWNGNDDRDAYMYYLNDRYNIDERDVERIEAAIASVETLHGVLYIPELQKFYLD